MKENKNIRFYCCFSWPSTGHMNYVYLSYIEFIGGSSDIIQNFFRYLILCNFSEILIGIYVGFLKYCLKKEMGIFLQLINPSASPFMGNLPCEWKLRVNEFRLHARILGYNVTAMVMTYFTEFLFCYLNERKSFLSLLNPR